MTPPAPEARAPADGAAPFAGPAGPTPADAAAAAGWALLLAALSLAADAPAPDAPPPAPSAPISGIAVTAVFALSVAWLRALRGGARFADILRLPRGVRAFARHLLFGGAAGLACVLPVMGLAWGMRALCARLGIPDPPQESLRILFAPGGGAGARAACVLAVVLGAPIAEETLYRALLFQGAARAIPPAAALAASSALFSAAHLSVPLFVPLLAVGLAFGAAYRRLGLAASVAAHAAFNAGNLFAGLLLP